MGVMPCGSLVPFVPSSQYPHVCRYFHVRRLSEPHDSISLQPPTLTQSISWLGMYGTTLLLLLLQGAGATGPDSGEVYFPPEQELPQVKAVDITWNLL